MIVINGCIIKIIEKLEIENFRDNIEDWEIVVK